MRISELARRAGVTVATVKYYRREGLLPPGRLTAVNQADYGEDHVHRLTLIRTLLDVGRLSVQQVHEVLAAVDDEQVSLHDAFGLAQDAMVRPTQQADARFPEARAEVDRLIDDLGWQVRPHAAVRDLLADALVMLWRTGWDVPDGYLVGLARNAEDLAALEIASIDDRSRSAAVERSVIGTVGYEVAINALRRLALEDASARRFGPGSAP